MDKRSIPTEAELRASLERQHLARVAPGDELGRRRAIKIAREQAEDLAPIADQLV